MKKILAILIIVFMTAFVIKAQIGSKPLGQIDLHQVVDEVGKPLIIKDKSGKVVNMTTAEFKKIKWYKKIDCSYQTKTDAQNALNQFINQLPQSTLYHDDQTFADWSPTWGGRWCYSIRYESGYQIP